ncbi:MAG: UDP-N-acetylglucosamine 1-carboxyvinyltransferase [Candidatus Peribacteraceae bacterium]
MPTSRHTRREFSTRSQGEAPPSDIPHLAREAMKRVDRSRTPSTNVQYRIQGHIPLKGTVQISGSKNAALPLLAGSLLCKGDVTFQNVPRLRDTETMLKILEFLGARTQSKGTTVTVNSDGVTNRHIEHDLVSKLRGSIVLLGPMLARFGEVSMAYPGGCVLGKRPVDAHIESFAQLGIENLSTDTCLHLHGRPVAGEVILPEFSVTATENILLTAALLPGETRIELAAAEPHVQDVCRFLAERGVPVGGIGSHSLTVAGKGAFLPAGIEHTVTSDYLETGAFILAGIASRGQICIRGAVRNHLLFFLNTLRRAGGKFSWEKNGELFIDGANSNLVGIRLQTNIFPGFPTDLQAPFGVILTQASGVSRIFEVLFEGRMAYLYELEKMGASVEILNSHQALIIGPTALQGHQVASNDIRAGFAMVLAGLCAEGETVVTDVRYIERGYDRLEQKLKSLGAKIVREEE